MTDKAYAEYAAALKAGQARKERGLLAEAVHYDPDSDRIVVEMVGGWNIGFMRQRIAEFADVSADDLVNIGLSPAGTTLELASYDVYVSLEGLFGALVPKEALSRLFASKGGQATSHAKAMSARANGRKGGRPKKETVSA